MTAKEKKLFKALATKVELKDDFAYVGWTIAPLMKKFTKSELKKMTRKQFEKKLNKLL